MKRIAKAGMAVGILFGSALVAYAITSLLFTQSQTSSFQKKTIFRFNLSTGLTSGEIGPGDSFSTSPTIDNDATEDMYVFIKVLNPTFNGEPLYIYDVDESWILIDDTIEDAEVYAYATSDLEMTVLAPGEETIPLTDKMTMRGISYPEYSAVEDPSFSFQVFALGLDDMPTVANEVWQIAKELFLLNANV